MSSGLLAPFALTMAVSLLIGIGLREYYESEQKFETFGTVRTFLLIGLLGFVLYLTSTAVTGAYVAGLLSLAAVLAVYYVDKLRQKRGTGIIGVLIGLLAFVIGPLSFLEPPWFVVLLAISVLFALHSKNRIRRFTDRLAPGEVLTVCKFLAVAAVVLPIIPDIDPASGGAVARALALLPVTPRQVWLAVVITTSISYAGYIAQVYLFPARGIQLTGLIGGLYSSTATVLVIARRSSRVPTGDAAAAVLFAIAMMYLRVTALIAIFRPSLLAISAPPLGVLAVAALACALWLRPRRSGAAPAQTPAEPVQHPLEMTAAILFAVVFAAVSAATKYTLAHFPEHGLRWLAFAVGFSDITPFVVSVLQGDLGISGAVLVQSLVIATASNNVLKAAYLWSAGSRALFLKAGPILLGFAVASLAYAAWR